MATKTKVEKMQEEEFSTPSIVVGMAASIGASALAATALKKLDIPVKGPKKLLMPIATFGIANWIGNEAMMAAAEETEGWIDSIKEAVIFMKEFKKSMKEIKNSKQAEVEIEEEDEFDEE